jgi:hypothetical protein
MSQVVRGRGHLVWKVLALSAALVLVGTACSKSNDSGSSEVTTVFAQNFSFHGMPDTISSGIHEFLFQNKESFMITHEMIPVAIPEGKTSDDIISEAKANGPSSEDDWLHIGGDFGAADTGAGVVEWLDLPPGNYAIACWQTGTQSGGDNGPPHAAKGMVFGFTVTS